MNAPRRLSTGRPAFDGRPTLTFVLCAALTILLALDTVSSRVHVNFGVLLPEQAVSPVTHDHCARLDWAHAEQSLVAEQISTMFGDHWSVVSGDEEQRRSTGSRNTASLTAVLNMSYTDTRCSDTYGPYAAMEIFYSRRRLPVSDDVKGQAVTSVFYGPCCKYALSSVGRYAKLWQVPVITSGGLVNSLSNRTSFPLLVRIVPPYNKLSSFIVELLWSAGWRHTAVIYHENLEEDSAYGKSECYYAIEAITTAISNLPKNRPQGRFGAGWFRLNSTTSSSTNDDVMALTGTDDDDYESHVTFAEPRHEFINEALFDRFNISNILEVVKDNARGKYYHFMCASAVLDHFYIRLYNRLNMYHTQKHFKY